MSNLYTIFGCEKLIINNKIEEIENKYKDYTYEKTVIDLADESIITLLNELNTIPLLEDYRLVILKNPKFINNDSMYDSRLISEFCSFIDNPIESTILITIIDFDAKSKIINQLRSKTNFLEVTSIDSKNIENIEEYVSSILQNDGYKIAKLALKELMSRVDHDYNRVIIELEKLKLYKIEDKNITLEDVTLLVSKDLEDSIYPMIEAVLTKNKAKAMEIYKGLKQNSIDESMILASLISRFNELYQVKELVEAGYSKEKIALAFNYKPGRVYYLMKDASLVSSKQLKNNLRTLMDIDYNIKIGNVDKKVALELYLLKL
ncbi:MAG: DNA polymerase III subunit delta [Anaeroplasmataceae bacterium]